MVYFFHRLQVTDCEVVRHLAGLAWCEHASLPILFIGCYYTILRQESQLDAAEIFL